MRKDGSRFFAQGLLTPLLGGSPGSEGYLKILRDRTEKKHAEERQELLIRELHHRVRNTLATVQAVASSTIRSARNMDEFSDAFIGRINALSQTHSLLTDDVEQAASLRELLDLQLGPYNDGSAHQVTMEGPPVHLPSELAVPISMAVHELTTNAAKYGSLSVEGGRVQVTWSFEEKDRRPVLRLEWREHNGPPVKPPTRDGFGTRLLERVLATQVNASVHSDFRPEGLFFVAEIPMGEGTGPSSS
jgi:two-component sensor histidine kinase